MLRSFPRTAAAAALLFAGAFTGVSMADVDQVIPLQSGWNLIQLQVRPANASPAAVFGGTTGFKAAWHYDASNALWQVYQKPQGTPVQQADQGLVNGFLPLGNLAPGVAYWVYMVSPAAGFKVTGTPPLGPTFPAQELFTGWNMVGFPVGGIQIPNNEPISLLAVLTSAGFDYDAILTWEASGGGSYKKLLRPKGDPAIDPLAGLPADAPFPNYTNADLGRGYWLRVTDPATLKPRLMATVRAEVDVEPKDNFPGQEDVNISGGVARRAPKNVQQIETIRFFSGEDVQTLSISNSSGPDPADAGRTIGGGIMIWEAVWAPTSDTNTVNSEKQPDPWVKLYNTPSEKVRLGANGQPLAPMDYTSLKGVTTLENDIVYLRLDRKNLGRGAHTGTLTLRTSVGDKSYNVVAETGGLEGDWKGYATITTVSGKRNKVPDIDLFLSFFEAPKTDGLLRGVIDSSNALLWPVDVPLVGYRLSDAGNGFTMGGSFVLPPGDQNNEPFDAFAETALAGNDIDWNNDGRLDVQNPFPFPVQRTVLLQGALIHGNPTDGYIIEGEYTELVHGMTKEPIKLLGRFSLERQSLTPFSRRRSLVSDTGIEPVISKSVALSPALTISAGQTRPSSFSTGNAIPIATEMELRSLQVGVQFASPLPHSNFNIRLRSPDPNGMSLIVFDGANGAVNPKTLEKITFPADRPITGDLANFIRTIAHTKGDPSLGQIWKLDITNNGPQAIVLIGWSLRLDGQPVTDVQGIVTSAAGAPVVGATVSLDGLPFHASAVSRADDPATTTVNEDGFFTLPRVPILPLNLSATHPAFGPVNLAQPGLDAAMYLKAFGSAWTAQNPAIMLSAQETGLRDRFNPLAGAPLSLGGVDGFASGSDTARFQLALLPGPGGSLKISAGPTMGLAGEAGSGHQVDFYALNAPPTALWKFGDGSSVSTDSPSVSHEYTKAGHYRVTIESPAGSPPQATLDVLTMPTVRRVPDNPSQVPGLANSTSTTVVFSSNTTAYVQEVGGVPQTGYIFQPFFNGGGSVPAHRISGNVGVPSQPDVYALDIDPQVLAPGDPPARVTALTPQHMYCASMDLDLAPHPAQVVPPAPATPYIPSHPFSSDGFDASGGAFVSADFATTVNINAQGFKEEDFNYTLDPTIWQNTRLIDKVTPLFMGAGIEAPGGLVWGNPGPIPDVNYAAEEQTARDSSTFAAGVDDLTFHPHSGTSVHSDLPEASSTVTHFRMACSIGSMGFVLTAPTPPASVKLAKDKPSTPDNPSDPDLVSGSPPTAQNLYFILQTGGLASQPGPSTAILP